MHNSDVNGEGEGRCSQVNATPAQTKMIWGISQASGSGMPKCIGKVFIC